MRTRSLSLREISRCEDAREPACKCRCGGTLHGAKRGSGQAFFEGLSKDDPHRLQTKAEKAEKKNRERDAIAERRAAAWREVYAIRARTEQ